MKKIISTVIAAAVAAAALTTAASAYEFGTDNRLRWDPEVFVAAEEFAELAEKPVITLTLETRETPEGYYCVKPCWDSESGWDFIMDESDTAPAMPDTKDSYSIEKEQTTLSFTVPEKMISTIKEKGIHFLGWGVNLKTMTLSADAPASDDKPAEDTTTAADETKAPDTTDKDNSPSGDTNKPSGDKGNADTGIEGIAAFAGVAVVAAAAVAVSKKRK